MKMNRAVSVVLVSLCLVSTGLAAWVEAPGSTFSLFRFDCEYSTQTGKVYFMGGRLGSTYISTIYEYDPVTGAYATKAAVMNPSVANYDVAEVQDDWPATGDHTMYVVSGFNVAPLTTVQRYSPSTDQLEVVSTDPWPGTIVGGGAAVVPGAVVAAGDKIYAFGGVNTLVSPYTGNQTWVYDPAAAAGSRWTNLNAPLAIARGYIAGAVADNYIYAIGGDIFDGASLIAQTVVERLDINNPGAGWQAMTSLPDGWDETRAFGFGSDSPYEIKNSIVVAGKGQWSLEYADCEIYDIAANTWSPFTPLNQARRNHAGCLIPPGAGTGMPGMWVWGGRQLNDATPLTIPEYYQLSIVPGAFDLLTPADGAINVPVDGDLTWQATVPVESYDVYMGWPTPTLQGNVTTNSYSYTGLNNGKQYRWYVIAKNGAETRQSTSTFQFTTVEALPPVPFGWSERAPVPVGSKNKNVKDGGALTYVGGGHGIPGYTYAFKGNNRYEFYQYDLTTNVWTTKESIPAINPDTKKKSVKKGSILVTGDDDNIYASKGNNTVYFWQYVPATGVWTAIGPTVPSVGTRVRGLKEGSGAVPVRIGHGQEALDYIYLLKGSGTTEFYRWQLGGAAWETMANAPLLPSNKPFKNGSRLAYDGDNIIYAMKGSYNTLYAYDVALGTWTTRDSVPKYGTMGKKKKVKDGSGLAYHGGLLYVLKGGNTNEFFAYDCLTGVWYTLADMPVIPTSTKKVKGGGTLIYATDNTLLAFRGNNTLQFWSYGIALAPGMSASGNDIMSGAVAPNLAYGLKIAPNPFTTATAISYTLPRAGNVSLKLYDVTGTLVTTVAQGYTAEGSYTSLIDATRLARGIYVLKFETEGYSTTRKLVLE